MRDDVVAAVKEFFVNRVMPEGINDTVIVLIPKGNSPECQKDFCPISLCNVIYHVNSKCLVNQLRPLLDELVPESPSAFILGRMTTDNASITFKCFYKIQQSKVPQNTHCPYKVDLTKAYDRIEWKFLEGALCKYGFCHKWISWVRLAFDR